MSHLKSLEDIDIQYSHKIEQISYNGMMDAINAKNHNKNLSPDDISIQIEFPNNKNVSYSLDIDIKKYQKSGDNKDTIEQEETVDDSIIDDLKSLSEKTSDVYDNLKEKAEKVWDGYKKVNAIFGKSLKAFIMVGALTQVAQVGDIAYRTGFDGEAFADEIIQTYGEHWDNYEKKDLYSICQSDAGLCLMAGSGATLAATSGPGLLMVGSAVATYCTNEETDCSTLNGFLMSLEEASGYKLTADEIAPIDNNNTPNEERDVAPRSRSTDEVRKDSESKAINTGNSLSM